MERASVGIGGSSSSSQTMAVSDFQPTTRHLRTTPVVVAAVTCGTGLGNATDHHGIRTIGVMVHGHDAATNESTRVSRRKWWGQ